MGSQTRNDSPADRPTDRPTDVGVMSHDRTLDIGTLGFWKVLHLKMHFVASPLFFPSSRESSPKCQRPNVQCLFILFHFILYMVGDPQPTSNQAESVGLGGRGRSAHGRGFGGAVFLDVHIFRLFTFLLDKNGQLNYNIDITKPKAWI